jgi:hypothetical protein
MHDVPASCIASDIGAAAAEQLLKQAYPDGVATRSTRSSRSSNIVTITNICNCACAKFVVHPPLLCSCLLCPATAQCSRLRNPFIAGIALALHSHMCLLLLFYRPAASLKHVQGCVRRLPSV